MKIYVTLEVFHGVIEEVCAFVDEKLPLREENKWLKSHNVTDDKKREELSFDCTEFRIFECRLRKR